MKPVILQSFFAVKRLFNTRATRALYIVLSERPARENFLATGGPAAILARHSPLS